MKPKFLSSVFVIAAMGSIASAQILGLKSNTGGALSSAPPTFGFTYAPGGGPVTNLGQVFLVTGAPGDFDGLAMDAANTYCFWLIPGFGSQMCFLSPAMVATPALVPLPNVEVRGAMCDNAGRLIGLDFSNRRLILVNKVTGAIIGSVALTLGGAPFPLSDACDISMTRTGAVISNNNEFYRVNLATGAMTPLYMDPNPGPDGLLLANAGCVGVSNTIHTYDCRGTDDLHFYVAPLWNRFLRMPDILNFMDAGRGDLATRVQGVNMNGHVVLPGYVPGQAGQPVHVEIKNSNGETVHEETVAQDNDGNFTVENLMLEGFFDVFVDCSHWLRRKQSVEFTETSASSPSYILRNGDAHKDNVVDLADFDRYVHAFGSEIGEPRYDVMSDFNGDGSVDLGDFDDLARNFGEEGD